jgi:hypothetical protein
MESPKEARLTDRRRDLPRDLQVLSLLLFKERERGVKEEWPVPDSAESVEEQKLFFYTSTRVSRKPSESETALVSWRRKIQVVLKMNDLGKCWREPNFICC